MIVDGVKIDKAANRVELADSYLSDYLKCKNDFHHFCKKYVLIELPGKDVHFNPYNKQRELIDMINKHRYVLVLKSRQIGISTIIQAYIAWLILFYDNVCVGIISKDGKEATDFARATRGMVEKVPDWMKPEGGFLGRGFSKRTEQSFILTNGSKVFASPVNPNAPDKTLRGKAITFLVIDEAAFVHYIDTAWTSLVPALSTSQMQARKLGIPYGTVVLSTPNKTIGVGRWYFERYSNAVTGDDILKPFPIHWRMIPELANDPNWYATQCALFNNDKKKIAQELELKFLPAEGSFFDAETVEKVQDGVEKPINVYKLYNGEIWQFATPKPGAYYIMGVDTAPEHGEDKSAVTVWDYQTLEQVWEYQGKCRVDDFVKVIKVAASTYPGLIVVESNSYGNQVLEDLTRSELSIRLYKEKRGNNVTVAGISNTSKTRPLIIDSLYSYINEFPHSVKSERLSLELTGLVSKASGRVEADMGCKDDLAMTAGMCFYVRKYDPPLMIELSGYSAVSQSMMDIVNYNTDNVNDLTNRGILQHVKDNLGKEKGGGYVDILSLYNRD
jgi:hypothetical protein